MKQLPVTTFSTNEIFSIQKPSKEILFSQTFQEQKIKLLTFVNVKKTGLVSMDCREDEAPVCLTNDVGQRLFII